MALEIPVEAIRSLVAAVTGFPASRVYWQGEAEKHIGPISGKAGKLTLTMTSAVEGPLEPRRTFDGEADPPTQTTEWGESEILTITIRADNFIGHGKAYDTLRKLKRGLRYPSSSAALLAADLAYLDAPSIQTLSNQAVDNRIISCAAMDVRLSFLASEVPDGPDGHEGWIEKVSSHNPPTWGDPPEDTEVEVYDLDLTELT